MLAELYVECFGAGPPLVFAHGFAGSARNFRPQVQAFRDRFRVITYDAPGHARSGLPRDAWGFGLPGLAEAMGEAIDRDAEASGPVIAVGLSLGAATALQFALDAPERVRALVLASFPVGGGRVASLEPSALEFAAAIEAEGVEAAGARYVWGDVGSDAASEAKWVRQGFIEHSPAGLAGVLRGALAELPDSTQPPAEWAAIRVPTLLVAGGRDAGALAASRALASVLGDARLEVIEGAGHIVNLAAPAEFNARLAAFFAAVLDPGAGASGVAP